MQDNYFLYVLQAPNNFESIRKLSNEECKVFEEASTFMHKLTVKLYFFRIVDHDYNELKNFEEEYNEQINYYPLSIDEKEIIFDFIRLLHNYLSSANLFIEQYRANVKRDYERELFEEFNELRKDLHAENLSYRIITELRNELHHSKIPSVTIEAERKAFLAPLEAKFYIHKDYLNIGKLKNDDEFQQLGELIDIDEHLENMNSYLLELAGKILKYELDLHLEHYDFLKNLIDEIGTEGRSCVIKYGEFSENKIQSSINFIDQRFIELIDKVKTLKDVL